jgi:hypothetical protein
VRRLGPIISSWSIERAMRDLLLPDREPPLIGLYEDEVNRQFGTPDVRVERPRSVKVRWSISRFADDQLPAIIVLAGGTVGAVNRDSEGLYTATWAMMVAGVAQASDEDIAREVASDLSKAAAAVVVHMLPKVDGRVISAQWNGEDQPIDLAGDERSRCAFGQRLQITVADHLCDLGGLPADWDEADPPMGEPPIDAGDLGTVEEVAVEVVPVEELT